MLSVLIISQVLQSLLCPWKCLECVSFHGFPTGRCELSSVHYSGVTGLEGTRNATEQWGGRGSAAFSVPWSESWGNFCDGAVDPNVWGSSWGLERSCFGKSYFCPFRGMKLNIECLTDPTFCSFHFLAKSCLCQR